MPNPLFEKFSKIKLEGIYLGRRYVSLSVVHQNRCQFCNIIKERLILNTIAAYDVLDNIKHTFREIKRNLT